MEENEMEKTEKIGRGSLLRAADNLVCQRKELMTQMKNLQQEYERLSEKYQPQIDDLQANATDLAREFRRLYEESQEAFSSGDGASAKSLSAEGHVIEGECRIVNNQANVLRNELRSILNEIQSLRTKARDLEALANSNYKKAVEMRGTFVDKFKSSGIMIDAEVEEFLDEFPQKIFEKISSIRFEDRVIVNESGITFGNHHVDEKSGKFEIEVYRHMFEKDMKETIAHEIGHTIFRGFMKDTPDRWQWGKWYQESMRTKEFIAGYDPGTREEDFCECFAQFKTDPEYLEEFDKQRFDFIKNIYDNIEKEKNI